MLDSKPMLDSWIFWFLSGCLSFNCCNKRRMQVYSVGLMIEMYCNGVHVQGISLIFGHMCCYCVISAELSVCHVHCRHALTCKKIHEWTHSVSLAGEAGLLGSLPVASNFHIKVKQNLPHLSVRWLQTNETSGLRGYSWKSFSSFPAYCKWKYCGLFSTRAITP